MFDTLVQHLMVPEFTLAGGWGIGVSISFRWSTAIHFRAFRRASAPRRDPAKMRRGSTAHNFHTLVLQVYPSVSQPVCLSVYLSVRQSGSQSVLGMCSCAQDGT